MRLTAFLFLLLPFLCFAQKENAVAFPKFSLVKMDSASLLTNKDLKENTNTVFLNFSPTCDHCERTIKSILKDISKFSETQFVFSSFEKFSDVRKFYLDNMLNSYTTVFVGYEPDKNLTAQVNYSSFPCAVIFDKNKQWVKKIEGETNAKEILKALKLK